MKMTLSTPSTISRNVRVASAIQICGSVSHSINTPSRNEQLPRKPASSHAVFLGVPLEAELGRRRHVADQRRGGDDGGAGEVAFAAESHAVLPVAVERRDRALARRQRVGALAEARAAPRLADLRRRPSGSTSAIDSPPSRGSGRSICRPTPPDPGNTTSSRSTAFDARARAPRAARAPPAAGRRSCRWCTSRSSPCRT